MHALPPLCHLFPPCMGVLPGILYCRKYLRDFSGPSDPSHFLLIIHLFFHCLFFVFVVSPFPLMALYNLDVAVPNQNQSNTLSPMWSSRHRVVSFYSLHFNYSTFRDHISSTFLFYFFRARLLHFWPFRNFLGQIVIFFPIRLISRNFIPLCLLSLLSVSSLVVQGYAGMSQSSTFSFALSSCAGDILDIFERTPWPQLIFWNC